MVPSTDYTASEAMALLTRTSLRPFTEHDFEAFAGIEAKEPMIGEFGGGVLIVDGEVLFILNNEDEGEGQLFLLQSE